MRPWSLTHSSAGGGENARLTLALRAGVMSNADPSAGEGMRDLSDAGHLALIDIALLGGDSASVAAPAGFASAGAGEANA